MFRGCLSDTSDARLLCERGNEFGACHKCPESGCNDQSKLRKPTIGCIKCNNAESCAFGHDQVDALPCTEDVLFGEVESCFTQRIESNFAIFSL